MRRSNLTHWVVLLLLAVSCQVDSDRESPLHPGDSQRFVLPLNNQRLAGEPELVKLLRTSPFAYFRFLNRQWSQSVCEMFQEDLDYMPLVNLHGDAHLEQYAVTNTEHGLQHGLDDFDDAASGPAVIDLVRFASSVYLVCEEFGWEAETGRIIDSFFEGYRKGLENQDFEIPLPSFAARARKTHHRTQAEFLGWAEGLMQPIDEADLPGIEAGIGRFVSFMYSKNPGFPPHYLDLKAMGALKMGIGSSLIQKVLTRFEGMTLDPLDDIIVEGKQLQDLSSITCIEVPEEEVQRVLIGTQRIGRLSHSILGYVPPGPDSDGGRPWWVKSWEPSYFELERGELRSPAELAEIVYDVGIQLGQGHVRDLSDSPIESSKLSAFEAFQKSESKIRRVSRQLVDEMLRAWEQARGEDGSN